MVRLKSWWWWARNHGNETPCIPGSRESGQKQGNVRDRVSLEMLLG